VTTRSENLLEVIDRLSKGFLLFLLLYLVYAWLAVYLYDFRQYQIPWLPAWSEGMAHNDYPALWFLVFGEASTTEILQWLCLLVSEVIILLSLIHRWSDRPAVLTMAIFAVGLFWMYLEDIANLRHLVSSLVSVYHPGYEAGSEEWRQSTMRSLVELSIYSLMAFLMVLSYLLIRKQGLTTRVGMRWLTAAYLTYGVVAFASASRHLGSWYAEVGGRLYSWIAELHESSVGGWDIVIQGNPLGYWFMDYVIEESVELLAAAMLCRACFILHGEALRLRIIRMT